MFYGAKRGKFLHCILFYGRISKGGGKKKEFQIQAAKLFFFSVISFLQIETEAPKLDLDKNLPRVRVFFFFFQKAGMLLQMRAI